MNNFTMYAPIVKIDKENRTVSGWATTEEIDKQNEVVDYLGSKDAFASWQGNIREMHEPRAVGKAVEIIPNDEEKRVWVSAYISKGAEDTWNKVQEGVLTGFSIGGQTVNKTTQIIKDMSTGVNRTVTRINKYRLNELSLVDNPANPGCSFTLVKAVDGVPYQTAIVEDSTRLIITEAEDPLKSEVHMHRDKADSLNKKVLDREELDGLTDADFGVIRKYQKDGSTITERLLPMSDKVHAVTALAIMEKYNLTPDEIEAVHKKAQTLLGTAYDEHNVSNRGGENEMSKEQVTKINEVLESLLSKVESLEKAFEGAFRPVPGAKDQPVEPSATPDLGESPAEKSMADSDTEKGIASALAAGGKAIAGKAKSVLEAAKPVAEMVGAKAKDAVMTGAPKVGDAIRTGASKVKDAIHSASEFAGKHKEFGVGMIAGGGVEMAANAAGAYKQKDTQKSMAEVIEAKNLSEEDLEKLYDGFIELEKAMAGCTHGNITDAPEVKPSAPEEGGDPATVMPDVKTHEAEEVVKGAEVETPAEEATETKEEETAETEEEKKKKEAAKKLADAKDEKESLTKVTNELETLRKRFDAVTELLNKPMPRKRIIEKNADSTPNADLEFQNQRAQVLEWVKSGKPLTAEQEKVRLDVLNKSMDAKFGKAL